MSDMLKKMRFVQGSVAKKDLLPALTHFRIENGHIQGYNGRIALSAPIDFAIDCTPKAEPLIKAITKCQEAVQLGMTATGRLSIKSGKFRSYIDCIEGPTAHVQPEGPFVELNGEVLLNALKKLQPFISNDAARPWSNGVRFAGQSAYATNNVVIAEHWLGSPWPHPITIHRDAVAELIRVGEAPVRFQLTETSLTAHYEDGRWLRCNLIDLPWPDVDKLFPTEHNMKDIPEEFFVALDTLKPFVDKFNRVIFEPGLARTHPVEGEEGSSYELEWLTDHSTFNIVMLLKLAGVAKKLDLSAYPKGCLWVGDGVRGVIVGMHWIEGEI